jgi:hypothetical protein
MVMELTASNDPVPSIGWCNQIRDKLDSKPPRVTNIEKMPAARERSAIVDG